MKQKPLQKAALYIRVSTDAQREEGYSIEAQTEMLEAYCKSKQIERYEFYVDGGFTGSNIERPEMRRLVEDVKHGKISHVVVYKLDRLSRSQKDTLYLIEDVFNPKGADFVSLNENMDTSTPIGRAMLGIMSAFAQLERETIRERTRMGMKERVKSGLWMGGGRIPFGYDYDRTTGVLVPNADAVTVRRIYDLYLQGYAPQKIAQMTGLKYDRLAVQILTRKTNCGYIVYKGEEYRGKHEPIVPLEIYEKAMDMMQERSVRRTPTTDYLLTGLVHCGKCGAKMRYQKWGKHGSKFVCYSQQTSKPYLVRDPDCDNERVWTDEVEDIVVRDLFKFSVERSESNPPEETLTALEVLRAQYDTVAAKVKRLYNLYAQNEDALLLETIEENQADLQKLHAQMVREQDRGAITAKNAEAMKRIEGVADLWDYMTVAEKQEVVRSCVEKICIRDNCVDIHYKLLSHFPQSTSIGTA